MLMNINKCIRHLKHKLVWAHAISACLQKVNLQNSVKFIPTCYTVSYLTYIYMHMYLYVVLSFLLYFFTLLYLLFIILYLSLPVRSTSSADWSVS